MRRVLLGSLAVGLAMLTMTGCGPDEIPAGGTSPSPFTITSTAPPPVNPTQTKTAAQMPTTYEADVNLAFTTVVQYWTAQFQQHGRTFTAVQKIVAYHGKNGPVCGTSRLGANNAAYCSDGDYIGYDTDFLQAHWASIGHAFVYFVIGHEYGHAIQQRLQLTAPVPIKAELQADCFSGAYLRGEIDDGDLALHKGDLDQMMNSLNAVGDPAGTPWLNSQAHGSSTDRKIAFFDGYTLKVRGCTTKL
jgi:predicted metalloprotease